MKYQSLLLSTLLLTSSFLIGQDSETRSVDSFDEVSVATGIDATLVKGSKNQVEIEVDNVDLDNIITEVRGGKLVVKVEQNFWKNILGKSRNRDVDVVITYTEDLEGLSISSGARVETDGAIETRDIEISCSSGANGDIEVEASEVEISVSSGAYMAIEGETAFLDVSVSSGASFKGKGLLADDVEASASSGASASVYADKSLKAKASSGGSISYKGDPNTDIKKSSGGSVSRS